MRKHNVSSALWAILILGYALFSARLWAQDTPTLSTSLSDQSNTTGLDTSYAEGAGALGTTFHSDVTDATHSDVFGTAMSPSVDEFSISNNVNAYSDSYAPQEDALQLSTLNGGGSRTPGDSSFSNSSFGSGPSSVSGFGKGTGEVAFRPTSENGLSAFVAGHLTGAGSNRMVAMEGSSSGTPSAGADPALLSVGSDAAMLEAGTSSTTSASPASEAAVFFMAGDTDPVQYQFDDGVTPELTVQLEPGRQLLPLSSTYSAPQNGFPDSTLGLAGLPLDTSEIHAPGGLKTATLGSSTEGQSLSFEMKTGVVPNLYASPPALPKVRFRAQQDRIFEQNVLNGMNVTQAEIERRKALAAYRQSFRGSSKSGHDLLNQQEQGNTQALLPDTPAASRIR
jgi:hypothetical protein